MAKAQQDLEKERNEYSVWLKAELAKRGWSGRELAGMLGRNIVEVSRYLEGKAVPRTATTMRIKELLGISSPVPAGSKNLTSADDILRVSVVPVPVQAVVYDLSQVPLEALLSEIRRRCEK